MAVKIKQSLSDICTAINCTEFLLIAYSFKRYIINFFSKKNFFSFKKIKMEKKKTEKKRICIKILMVNLIFNK